ncbi:MAG: VOC family protein [Archangium sp.]|nr:VOC family protein [Archangium sp.]
MIISQLRIVADDFTATFRFYRDTLGLIAQPDDERGPYSKFTAARGDTALALQSRSHAEAGLGPLRLGAGAIVVFRVEDLDTTLAQLRARGASVVEAQVAWGRMRVAHLRDPEGTVVELQQWSA